VFIEKKNVCMTEISLIEIFTPWQLWGFDGRPSNLAVERPVSHHSGCQQFTICWNKPPDFLPTDHAHVLCLVHRYVRALTFDIKGDDSAVNII